MAPVAEQVLNEVPDFCVQCVDVRMSFVAEMDPTTSSIFDVLIVPADMRVPSASS